MRDQPFRGFRLRSIGLGAQLLKDGTRPGEMMFGGRSRARLRDEAADREMTEAGLVLLTKQIEQRGALREGVIRVGGTAMFRIERAAQPQVFAPQGGRVLRIEAAGRRGQALVRCREPVGGGQRLSGDERGLQRFEWGSAGRENRCSL